MRIDIGAIAKDKREKLGLTQQQVADKACVDKGTVKAFEGNKRSVGLDHILSIFDVLGLKIVVEDNDGKGSIT